MNSILYLVVFFLTTCDCQICRRTDMVARQVPVTYQYTYQEVTHDPSCWFVNCMKTETKTAKDVNMVERYDPVEKFVCCDGYEEINENGNSTCQPKCSSPCLNGICIKPETCSCNDGYVKDPENSNKCLPICVVSDNADNCKPTKNPTDKACTLGYYNNDTCQDLCAKPCINGFCIDHDTCICRTGFIKRDNFVCIENCTDCDCNEGWYSKDGECIPICDQSCGNGTCIAPNTCDCPEGYEISKDGQCQPKCECVGVCVAPNICSCEMPYDVELIGGKETCYLVENSSGEYESTTVGKEIGSINVEKEIEITTISKETISTTDREGTVTSFKEYSYRSMSINEAAIPVKENENNNFLANYWYYIVLLVVIVLLIIIFVVCFRKMRTKLSVEGDMEVAAVTYQKDS